MPGGQLGRNAPHIVDEPHVQHAVRLVQDKGLHIVQAYVPLVHQVHEPSGAGHHNVRPPVQGLHLGVLVYAAEKHAGEQGQLLAIGHKVVLNLLGQLPGGGENQRADGPGRAGPHRAAGKVLQNGQGKGRGFARARLGTAQHILTGKHQGNGGRLDGRGGGITALGHGLQQLRH